MTDPETASRTYVGPMTPESVEEIIAKEKPDALLPTMGGQTALNLTKALAEGGILEKHNVELIGAKLDAINKAEDRQLFKEAMEAIGLKTPPSGTANTWEEAEVIAAEIGSFPLIIRPAFTLGGSGGGIAYNMEEYQQIVTGGLNASTTTQVLIEKSLLGWKEYELEVMRDLADNVVIVCSIENFDPMGVHTGDSITIAPAQTLTDKEYQRLRDASVAIIREIGVECGGSNVQMAVNPVDGELMIIEMNPRVSRSSALASKATGFPIAKMAAKLAVGCTLDGIPNDITLKTPASFEPSIDYVVTKIPRFAFEKFPGAVPVLTTQMKSVGEAMALGRTWQESFNKALRSLEIGLAGWGLDTKDGAMQGDMAAIKEGLRVPSPDRLVVLHEAFLAGMTEDEIIKLTAMDPWFIRQLGDLYATECWLKSLDSIDDLDAVDWTNVKKRGFSDVQVSDTYIAHTSTCKMCWNLLLNTRRLLQVARALNATEREVRDARVKMGVSPSMKRVDTCAAEFEAPTPYMYSSYDGWAIKKYVNPPNDCITEFKKFVAKSICNANKQWYGLSGRFPTGMMNQSQQIVARSSFSVVVRTELDKALSLTTAVATLHSLWLRLALKQSCSTAIQRQCPPTTTPRTAYTSSPSPWRTCSMLSRLSALRESLYSLVGRRRSNLPRHSRLHLNSTQCLLHLVMATAAFLAPPLIALMLQRTVSGGRQFWRNLTSSSPQVALLAPRVRHSRWQTGWATLSWFARHSCLAGVPWRS